MVRREKSREEKQFLISVLLALVALVSVTAATVAWFTIADFTKVHSMRLEVTMGTNLRIDLDSHEEFEDYVKALEFSRIADRIQKESGFDMRKTPLMPVTTSNGQSFVFEDGSTAEKGSGVYLEFTLHFMATDDMLVHLTSQNSSKAEDGTVIESSNANLPDAMRISFTIDDRVYIYDPGMGNNSYTKGRITWFGLPETDKMIPGKHTQLFELEKNTDCPVIVRIWLEGTAESCTNEIGNSDYSIRLRFVGTDNEYNILTGDGH